MRSRFGNHNLRLRKVIIMNVTPNVKDVMDLLTQIVIAVFEMRS